MSKYQQSVGISSQEPMGPSSGIIEFQSQLDAILWKDKQGMQSKSITESHFSIMEYLKIP